MVVSRQTRACVGPSKEAVPFDLPEAGPPSDQSSRLETLIRNLVVAAGSSQAASAAIGDHQKEQVIIDTEIDGVRCVLTRMAQRSSSEVSFSPRESEIARMVAKGYPN